jgi:hypothetical protein
MNTQPDAQLGYRSRNHFLWMVANDMSLRDVIEPVADTGQISNGAAIM